MVIVIIYYFNFIIFKTQKKLIVDRSGTPERLIQPSQLKYTYKNVILTINP